MLEDYLLQTKAFDTAAEHVMPGVRTYRFSLSGTVRLPPVLSPRHFETLFCQQGCLTLERVSGPPISVESREILLLSAASALRSAEIPDGLKGLLIAVDAPSAMESLASLCRLMGLGLDIDKVRRRMALREGCAVLHRDPWSLAAFEQLDSLPEAGQGRYGVLKAVELLYLLCTDSAMLKDGTAAGRYQDRLLWDCRKYMENHLSDKLTIADMSRRFSLSQTALKAGFQRMYGTSIHRWVQEQRLRRAGELLRTAPLSVQEVAQAVGYEGVSQFHAAFKRRYGVTPGQYAKMSETGES